MVNGVVEIPLPLGGTGRGCGPANRKDRATAPRVFVAGPENRLVPLAVESVLSDADDGYNPVVFYGRSGTGKSHLALGLATAWKARFRGRPVAYVTAPDFARQLTDAIQTKTVEDFAARYRRVSLLVFEDVDYLVDKRSAQQELLFTFDALANAGSRLVLTSRSLPAKLPGTLPGLRARLASGLTVPLAPPGREARLVVLRELARSMAIGLAGAAAGVLAEGLSTTVPQLSGALRELAGPAVAPIDVEAARRYVAGRNGSPEPSTHQIALTTARYFALPLAELKSASRLRRVATARAVAIYLARALTAKSLLEIGRYFGGRDHTTVSYSCHVTEERLETDPEVRQAVLMLQETLKNR